MMAPMMAPKNNKISVVIVNYNAGPFLVKCIESVHVQADEIIIVDNASVDNSLDESARQFAAQPKIKFVENTTNLGFASACNIGIAHSKSDVVLFLNPDCQIDKFAVGKMLQILLSDQQIGMVGCQLINPDGSEQAGGRRYAPTLSRSLVRAFGRSGFGDSCSKFADFNLHKQPLPKHPVEVEAISGACLMTKREAIDDVGLWDEAYFLHCEDLDWCMRYRRKGWKILFVPEARVVHELGVYSQSRLVFVEWHKHKGMIRYFRKFLKDQYPWGTTGLVALGVWLRFGVVTVWKTVSRT